MDRLEDVIGGGALARAPARGPAGRPHRGACTARIRAPSAPFLPRPRTAMRLFAASTPPAGMSAARDRGREGALRSISRSVDGGAVLAVVGFCIMFAVLLLQGFGIGGFYIGDSPLAVLVASMSALVGLWMIGEMRRGIASPGCG